jgi:hypothetical protein
MWYTLRLCIMVWIDGECYCTQNKFMFFTIQFVCDIFWWCIFSRLLSISVSHSRHPKLRDRPDGMSLRGRKDLSAARDKDAGASQNSKGTLQYFNLGLLVM